MPPLESVRVQAMTTIDDELKALDEAYLKKFKDLFGSLFENMAAKDADALKHFEAQKRGEAGEMRARYPKDRPGLRLFG
jgi:mRNA-degrading endonuclease RelE of RelBE toxin-antitoxin system